MGQGMPFTRLCAKAFMNLTTEAIKLFTQRTNQPVQTLPVLFIDATAAVFENTVGEVFKLGANALFAVGQQALTIVGRHPWSLSASLHWRH